jgi:hypothetical protein
MSFGKFHDSANTCPDSQYENPIEVRSAGCGGNPSAAPFKIARPNPAGNAMQFTIIPMSLGRAARYAF